MENPREQETRRTLLVVWRKFAQEIGLISCTKLHNLKIVRALQKKIQSETTWSSEASAAQRQGTFSAGWRLISMKTRSSRILTILLSMAALALAACSAVATPSPEEPISSDDPANSTPQAADWQPQPGDDKLTAGIVEITSTEILTLESFPPQFVAAIEGSKPTPCHQLRAVIGKPEDETHQIDIEVYSVSNPDEICTQVIQDFNLNLPLGSYPAGQYTVLVNGKEIGQIVAP